MGAREEISDNIKALEVFSLLNARRAAYFHQVSLLAMTMGSPAPHEFYDEFKDCFVLPPTGYLPELDEVPGRLQADHYLPAMLRSMDYPENALGLFDAASRAGNVPFGISLLSQSLKDTAYAQLRNMTLVLQVISRLIESNASIYESLNYASHAAGNPLQEALDNAKILVKSGEKLHNALEQRRTIFGEILITKVQEAKQTSQIYTAFSEAAHNRLEEAERLRKYFS